MTQTMAQSASGHSKTLLSIVLIVFLIGGGAGIARLLYAMREEAPHRDLAEQAPLVDSVVLQAETITERFVGYGSGESVRSADLAAEVAGRVIELVDHVRAGSIVRDGQLLVRLDNREYLHALDRMNALASADQAALDELMAEAEKLGQIIKTAEDELRVAHNEFLRVADLHERNLAAKKEYDFANLAYQQARRVLQGYQMTRATIGPRKDRLIASRQAHLADAEFAKLNVERCEIRAPFPGRIQTSMIEVGERVGPGSVLMTLVDPLRVEIAIQLPASVYDHTRVGAACRLESESLPGVTWDGQVTRIAPTADQTTRTFAAYVEVDNTIQSQPLIPGMFVRAEVQGPTHEDRILVPRGAIRNGSVLVAESPAPGSGQGVAWRRSVAVERLVRDRAIVSGQVASGDRIILSHMSQLGDGSPVRLRTTAETSSNAE